MPKKHLSPADKVAILRRHLLDKVPVSSLCEEYQIHPNTFFQWQKQLFENANAVFLSNRSAETKASRRRIAQLEEKLTRKHEVLSELMEEYIRLKKELGEP